MIVDDEDTFRRVTTLFLETHHRREVTVVAEAADGQECLEKLVELEAAVKQDQTQASRMPQVVLVDRDMPKLNGLQTITNIRIMFPNIIPIALTLNDREGDRRAVDAAGGYDLVSKAQMLTHLMPVIRKAVKELVTA